LKDYLTLRAIVKQSRFESQKNTRLPRLLLRRRRTMTEGDAKTRLPRPPSAGAHLCVKVFAWLFAFYLFIDSFLNFHSKTLGLYGISFLSQHF